MNRSSILTNAKQVFAMGKGDKSFLFCTLVKLKVDDDGCTLKLIDECNAQFEMHVECGDDEVLQVFQDRIKKASRNIKLLKKYNSNKRKAAGDDAGDTEAEDDQSRIDLLLSNISIMTLARNLGTQTKAPVMEIQKQGVYEVYLNNREMKAPLTHMTLPPMDVEPESPMYSTCEDIFCGFEQNKRFDLELKFARKWRLKNR